MLVCLKLMAARSCGYNDIAQCAVGWNSSPFNSTDLNSSNLLQNELSIVPADQLTTLCPVKGLIAWELQEKFKSTYRIPTNSCKEMDGN